MYSNMILRLRVIHSEAEPGRWVIWDDETSKVVFKGLSFTTEQGGWSYLDRLIMQG